MMDVLPRLLPTISGLSERVHDAFAAAEECDCGEALN
jgi:hypothetical protein